MAERLDDHTTRRLEPGDILMVNSAFKPKGTNSYKPWKFFVIVLSANRYKIVGLRIGTDWEDKDRSILILPYNGYKTTCYYLPEAEWPDGVCAFRMKAVLEGRVELV
jgi:hypothetical protein